MDSRTLFHGHRMVARTEHQSDHARKLYMYLAAGRAPMIAGLIIGPAHAEFGRPDPLEKHVLSTQSPQRTRTILEDFADSEHEWFVVTRCPMVIYFVFQIWHCNGADDPFAHVVIRSENGVHDVPLLEIKEREWLAHFELGDLYIRGEFDDVVEMEP